LAPQTGTALLLLAAFVLPGFITLLLRERTYWVRGEDSPFERLLNALYYSALIYLVVAVAAVVRGTSNHEISELYHGGSPLWVYLVLGVIGFLALPLMIAEFGRRWQLSRRLRPWVLRLSRIDPGHSVPAGWEQLFLQSEGALEGRGLLLRVTLEDDRVVGGFFGDKSLAGYTAQTRDLYLEERWELDDEDWFRAPVAENRGLWLSDSQIRSIEAYAPPPTDPTQRGGSVRTVAAVLTFASVSAIVAKAFRS
jgi:hypothetical protein